MELLKKIAKFFKNIEWKSEIKQIEEDIEKYNKETQEALERVVD